jgi:hypothetical protein
MESIYNIYEINEINEKTIIKKIMDEIIDEIIDEIVKKEEINEDCFSTSILELNVCNNIINKEGKSEEGGCEGEDEGGCEGEEDFNDLPNIIDKTSEKIEQPPKINIFLKDHQLAMVYKCQKIEKYKMLKMGIMNDKPGTGKTYVILTLIYLSKKKGNIIVVPQNIINQWISSIDNFSSGSTKLNYKCFTNYEDIMQLYTSSLLLYEYDILITTSLYYNVISTTMNSNFQFIERIFFLLNLCTNVGSMMYNCSVEDILSAQIRNLLKNNFNLLYFKNKKINQKINFRSSKIFLHKICVKIL